MDNWWRESWWSCLDDELCGNTPPQPGFGQAKQQGVQLEAALQGLLHLILIRLNPFLLAAEQQQIVTSCDADFLLILEKRDQLAVEKLTDLFFVTARSTRH